MAKNSEIQLLFSIGYGSSLDCTIIVYSIVVGSQKVVGIQLAKKPLSFLREAKEVDVY